MLPETDSSVIRGVGPRRLFNGVVEGIGRLSPALDGGRRWPRLCHEGERSRESAGLQCVFTPLAGHTRTMKTDRKHGSQQRLHPSSRDRGNGLIL